jgi:hypothetical protein
MGHGLAGAVRIAVELDPAAALHVEHGLELHRAWCAHHRRLVPTAFDDLARQVAIAKTWTEPDTQPDEGTVARDDEPDFFTRSDFAYRCGRSERTVRRWIAAGKVRASVAGIPRSELDRLRGNHAQV